ncbi:MAG: ABC transporter permease [Methanosarcinales archaeon]|jgi:putative ABC transport system permease protein|nr:ABC transporter permease [Methanosarcinales archaeon]
MISISHSTKMAIGSLKSAKVRSALTALGIIIGIAAVIATFTLGASFGAYFSDQISAGGSNYIMIMSSKENLFFDQQVEVVRNTRGIEAATPVLTRPGAVTFMGESKNMSITGVRGDYQEIAAIPMVDGVFLSDRDTAAVVIGKNVSEDDFRNQISTRSSIQITVFNNVTGENVTRAFSVKGISGSEETTLIIGSDSNTAVFIPLSVLQEMSGRYDYPMIYAIAEYDDVIQEANDEVRRNLARNLGVSERNLDDRDLIPFNTINQAQLLEQVGSITQTMQLFLIAIGGISLIVGSVGIMNIMIVTVTERTKEIGTLKALGYTSADVLTLFLIESIVISVIGGVIGTALGLGISYIGTSLLGISMALSYGAILGAILISVIIGVLAGVYPAKRAADMNPVDALRSI